MPAPPTGPPARSESPADAQRRDAAIVVEHVVGRGRAGAWSEVGAVHRVFEAGLDVEIFPERLTEIDALPGERVLPIEVEDVGGVLSGEIAPLALHAHREAPT